jgi:GNAT superfamily N-acetyltransferase
MAIQGSQEGRYSTDMKTLAETASCRVVMIGPEDEAALRDATALARRVSDEQRGDGTACTCSQWAGRLRQDPGAFLLVGYRGEKAVGLAFVHSDESGACASRWLGVLPDHRNQGIATILLRQQEQMARQRGFSHIRCKVPGRSQTPLRMALLFGMEILGVEREDGSDGILVILGKDLSRPMLSTPARHGLSFTVEGWPIKRACELEKIYIAAFGEMLDEGHPTLDEMILLDSTYENILHVALVDGRPVGFKHAQERTRGMLHSHIGAVHPDFRGGGVAGALMKAQHQWAALQGYAGITTRSRNRYPHMLRLNLKHGFEIVGVTQSLGELAIHLYKPLR